LSLDRRRFLEIAAWAGAGAGLSALGCPRSAEARRPNVLFIAVDDLNNWAGCLGGHPDARTPNLDRLAKRGTLFTAAHCPSPLCAASRTAVFTGLEAYTSGIYANQEDFREYYPEMETLPQRFRAEGYHTMGVGKLFHIPDPGSFDEHVQHGQANLRHKRSDDSWGFLRPLHHRDMFNWGPLDVRPSQMFDVKVVRSVEEFLTRDYDRPFFLAAGLFQPHLPWFVPAEYFEPFPPEEITMPLVKPNDLRDVPRLARWTVGALSRRVNQLVIRNNQARKAVASYLAAMAYMDDNLGKILRALRNSAYADDTLVVLWSDHGHLLGEKDHWGKHALWEQATQVPLVVKGPGIAEGVRCAVPVTLIHLYPTLLDLCGLTPKTGLDGRSLVPLIRHPDAAWDVPAIMNYGQSLSVRSERWRYTRYSDGAEELYDHQHDPHEWDNMAAAGPLYNEVKTRLAATLPTRLHPAVSHPTDPLPDDA
jgi:arylsulfatase A-like enzyme